MANNLSIPHIACAVCGHVLNHYSGAFGDSWIHTLDSDNDHLPVPVPVESIRTTFMCDFCLTEGARWELPVEDYSASETGGNVGNWAACDSCAELLRTNNWDALTIKAWTAMRERHQGEEIPPREAFDIMYQQLRKHIIGEVRLDPEQL